MDPADLDHLWRSPHNQPSAAQLEEDRMTFITDLRRRHRGFVVFMALVFAALAIPTAQLIYHLLASAPGTDHVDVRREWGVLAALAMPWAAWAFFIIQYRRHRAAFPDGDTSIRASVQALLDDNRMARGRNVMVGALQAGFVVVLPLIVRQLKAAGKAGSEIDVTLIVVPAIFGAILLGLIWNHQRTLLPRKRELEALLKSYDADPRPSA